MRALCGHKYLTERRFDTLEAAVAGRGAEATSVYLSTIFAIDDGGYVGYGYLVCPDCSRG